MFKRFLIYILCVYVALSVAWTFTDKVTKKLLVSSLETIHFKFTGYLY